MAIKDGKDWVTNSYYILKITDRATNKVYKEYDFACKMKKYGYNIDPDCLEGVSLCTNGEYYLIDKRGNALYIDRAKYKFSLYNLGYVGTKQELAYKCNCLSVNVGALGAINFDLKAHIRLLQVQVKKLQDRINYLTAGCSHKRGYSRMKIPGRFSSSLSRRERYKNRREK